MAKRKTLAERLRAFLIARYPISYIVSSEEERVISALKEAVRSLSSKDIDISIWSLTDGLVRGKEHIDERDPVKVLDSIARSPYPEVFVLKDIHLFFESDPVLLRKIRDVYLALRDTNKFVFITAPRLVLPVELRKEVAVLDAGLPEPEEIADLFDDLLERIKSEGRQKVLLNDEGRKKFVRALQGLTVNEVRHALNRVLFGRNTVDESALEFIFEEKAMLTRKEGVLEFFPSAVTIKDIGGLENLKEWLYHRKPL
ncbi:hypothetical protein ACFLU6_15665, partial [Acidobacteriota bacterium]